jgi:uncharacterized protein (DUF1697 family)
MTALRQAAEAAGLAEVRTVLATGNLIFRSPRHEADLAAVLTGILDAHGLGPAQAIFLRRPAALAAALAANPFPMAARDRPSRLLCHFLQAAPPPDRIAAFTAWQGPELCAIVGREAFIDYRDGIGTSKLTGAILDRLLGQSGTARNWNTVGKLVASAWDP